MLTAFVFSLAEFSIHWDRTNENSNFPNNLKSTVHLRLKVIDSHQNLHVRDCLGTLLGQNTILTAGHCLKKNELHSIEIRIPSTKTKSNAIFYAKIPGKDLSLKVHPEFKKFQNSIEESTVVSDPNSFVQNDLGLIQLKYSIFKNFKKAKIDFFEKWSAQKITFFKVKNNSAPENQMTYFSTQATQTAIRKNQELFSIKINTKEISSGSGLFDEKNNLIGVASTITENANLVLLPPLSFTAHFTNIHLKSNFEFITRY